MCSAAAEMSPLSVFRVCDTGRQKQFKKAPRPLFSRRQIQLVTATKNTSSQGSVHTRTRSPPASLSSKHHLASTKQRVGSFAALRATRQALPHPCAIETHTLSGLTSHKTPHAHTHAHHTMEAAAAADAQAPPARILLVGVDDSADSAHAFDFAVEHLLRPGDELHLVHVIPRLQFASMYGEEEREKRAGEASKRRARERRRECACPLTLLKHPLPHARNTTKPERGAAGRLCPCSRLSALRGRHRKGRGLHHRPLRAPPAAAPRRAAARRAHREERGGVGCIDSNFEA